MYQNISNVFIFLVRNLESIHIFIIKSSRTMQTKVPPPWVLLVSILISICPLVNDKTTPLLLENTPQRKQLSILRRYAPETPCSIENFLLQQPQ
jgi:hypothetical protein